MSMRGRRQLPKGWAKKQLKDVCTKVEYGTSAKSQPEGKVPVLRMGNIQDGGIDWENLAYTSDQEEIDKYLLKYNDVLFNRTNSAEHVGKAAIYKGEMPAIFAGYLIRIHRKEELINADFLNYYLNSDTAREYGRSVMSQSVNQANINGTKLKEYPIPVPPIAEQKQIVAILDEAFEGIDGAIANTEKNLANARELFESYLNAIFTRKGDDWIEKKLGDLSEVQSGGTPLRHKSEYWGGDIAWYSSGELNDLYTIAPQRHITDVGLDNSNAKLFPKGSLLIGMYDTAALKMSILDRDAAFNQAVAGMKPNENIDLVFMLHALNFVKPEVLSLRRGVRQKNLSLKKIKNIAVAVPKLEEQRRVVEQLASISNETQRLEAIYQQKLAALNELKQSILQRAFSGELTAEVGDAAVAGAREVVAA
jgi:type I restriction enzyme S subunit